MAEIEAPSNVVVTAVLPRKVWAALVVGAVLLALAITLTVLLLLGVRDAVSRNCQFISARATTLSVERDVYQRFKAQADAAARNGPPAQRADARTGAALLQRLVVRATEAERRDRQIRDRPAPLGVRIISGCG